MTADDSTEQRRWLKQCPEQLETLSDREVLHHLYPSKTQSGEPIDPCAGYDGSKARLALVGSGLKMFYAATTFMGAVWETILRDVDSAPDGLIEIALDQLEGRRAVTVRPAGNRHLFLPFKQPFLRKLGHNSDSSGEARFKALAQEPDHAKTHEPAKELREELKAHGYTDMPGLAWISRQHNESTVYLFFDPAIGPDEWVVLWNPIALDTPEGHALLKQALEKDGFYWPEPLYDPDQTPAPLGFADDGSIGPEEE